MWSGNDRYGGDSKKQAVLVQHLFRAEMKSAAVFIPLSEIQQSLGGTWGALSQLVALGTALWQCSVPCGTHRGVLACLVHPVLALTALNSEVMPAGSPRISFLQGFNDGILKVAVAVAFLLKCQCVDFKCWPS